MLNLDLQEKNFKNHIATLTDYGSIKILDFKNPNSSAYRIRFLFEEDYCRLHISGDLGELTATNYNNMRYEKFGDFVNNVGYFAEKIDCHSRPLYYYDINKAREDLKQIIVDYELSETIVANRIVPFDFRSKEDAIEDFIGDVLFYFDDSVGIGPSGYSVLSEVLNDAWEFTEDIGRKDSGILGLYMLAFKLAQEQLEKRAEAALKERENDVR